MVSNKTITVLGTVAVVIATSALVLSIGPLRAMALPIDFDKNPTTGNPHSPDETGNPHFNGKQVVHPWAAPETHMVKLV